MQEIDRMMAVVPTDDLAGSKAFYLSLFNLKVDYDSDWFIHLMSEGGQIELGIIQRSNDAVPSGLGSQHGGIYLTLVVQNVDKIREIAATLDCEIILEPRDTPYGQRQLIIKDPNGVSLDISSPIPGFN